MIIVIGRGVLGLSVAEYLSRQGKGLVVVCSDEQFAAASSAAAANLSTKGQLFARDPHFELKLKSKADYPSWLEELEQELKKAGQSCNFSSHYLCSKGRDVFETIEQADKQWRRIAQPIDELERRGLSQQLIYRPTDFSIEYDGEAWVDALYLLRMLEAVCLSRGVQFLNKDARELAELLKLSDKLSDVILCAGSYSPSILESWGCANFFGGQGRKFRCSYGGTLCAEVPNWYLPDGLSLLEFIGDTAPEKVTFSGKLGRLFASSVSVTCPFESSFLNLNAAEKHSVASQKQVVKTLLAKQFGLSLDSLKHEWRWGWRLGFGHRELLVEQVPHRVDGFGGRIFLVAGAHKSGFLFAPVIGSLVGQKLQS
ncbi:MAG: hypothetical protein RJB13_2052 [Pseudomonadota bacterium]